jgi:hypothetical protein
MDKLEQILRDRIDTEGDGDWSISNNTVLIVVTARTSETFGTPAEAFDGAVALVAALTEDGNYVAINRANLGVECSPVQYGRGDWRATIDVCLWRAEELDDHSRRVSGI